MTRQPTFRLAVFLSCLFSQSVQAQVAIPDSSLGSEFSIVSPSQLDRVNREEVTGGAVRDSNLFHSFESFGVGEGAEVYFISPDGISRIFSRVTGTSTSEILGTLGVSGATDLFFLNSNGIVFGPNSALDIDGSLVLSTAESIKFPDGIFRSNPGSDFLSAESPISLNLNSTGTIRVENQGSDPFPFLPPSVLVSTPIQYSATPGLSLAPQNTLALIANGINLDGAIVRAVDGRIALVSTSGEVNVSLDKFGYKFGLDSGNQAEFSDINLGEAAIVQATGSLSGQIEVTGRNVSLTDGAALVSSNYGGQNFLGGLVVNADSLSIGTDTTPPGLASDTLFSQSINGGKGGNIVLSVNDLRIVDGGQILATATDSSSAGDIQIGARNSVVVDGADPIKVFLSSAINNVTYGAGQSGSIGIDTNTLQVLGGGIISTSTIGSGEAGDVEIISNDVKISGVMPFVFRPSFIGSITTRTGDSGELNIETQRLAISDGGATGTSTLGSSGNSARTSIRADESIQVVGQNLSGTRSSIISNSAATSEAVQNASEVDGALLGNAGGLRIDTPVFLLQDRGFIGVQNDGTSGGAGSIAINAENLRVLDSSDITASTAGGQGGNIQILSTALLVANQSSIQAAVLGVGDGGNVSLNSQVLGLFRNSKISADAELGRGGRVILTSSGLFNDSSSSITVTSARGPSFDGVVDIQTPNPALEESTISPSTEVQYPKLALACNSSGGQEQASLTISGAGGIPDTARGPLRGYSGWGEDNNYSLPAYHQAPVERSQGQERSDCH